MSNCPNPIHCILPPYVATHLGLAGRSRLVAKENSIPVLAAEPLCGCAPLTIHGRRRWLTRK